VKEVRPVKNERGEIILECPSDPKMVRDLLIRLKAIFKPHDIIYAGGEGGGWAIKAAFGQGINVIATEENDEHWAAAVQWYVFYMYFHFFFGFRLENKIAKVSKETIDSEKKEFSIRKWYLKRQKLLEQGKIEMEVLTPEEKAVRDLKTRFPAMQPEVAKKVVQVVFKAGDAYENKLVQEVGEATISFLPGITTHVVSLDGVIYRMTPDQWKVVEEILSSAGQSPQGMHDRPSFNIVFSSRTQTYPRCSGTHEGRIQSRYFAVGE
jgi:hypothetical protein